MEYSVIKKKYSILQSVLRTALAPASELLNLRSEQNAAHHTCTDQRTLPPRLRENMEGRQWSKCNVSAKEVTRGFNLD